MNLLRENLFTKFDCIQLTLHYCEIALHRWCRNLRTKIEIETGNSIFSFITVQLERSGEYLKNAQFRLQNASFLLKSNFFHFEFRVRTLDMSFNSLEGAGKSVAHQKKVTKELTLTNYIFVVIYAVRAVFGRSRYFEWMPHKFIIVLHCFSLKILLSRK